ncbi:MAG: hypothetical protein ACI9Y1_002784 [Lentisphaeria bacterium]|jgi:hypothetical protein
MNDRNRIKPTKTKAETRAEISSQIDNYLQSGGEVNCVQTGISGRYDNTNLFSHSTSFEPKKERTPVTDVIRDMDERKQAKHRTTLKTPGPKKKLLTDDFGEPVRWVWVDK